MGYFKEVSDIRLVKVGLYMISVLWSAYLIWSSYKQIGDMSTALITVIVLLANMVFNDLIKQDL